MASETVLVTGGAGLIGAALCRRVCRNGHQVVALDDLSVGNAERLPAAVRLVRGDVRDAGLLHRLLLELRPRRVFHLAALHFIPECNARPVDTLDINVGGTRNLLEGCQRVRPRSVFVASTAAVYPVAGSPFSEETPVGPIDIYGHSKAMAEDLARLFHRDTGVRTVVGRLFNVIGPDDPNPHLVPAVVSQVRSGRAVLEIGNLEPVRDYVHVDDVVAGILAAEGGAAAEWVVYNIGSGCGRSVRQVLAAAQAAAARPIEIVQTAERRRAVERQELVGEIAKLSRDTAWTPRVPFEAAIAALVWGEAG
ncbi:MAG TPA: NAD-dependent epimerase/dehydratase family protein [Vicinamibacteria bacterium]|nr:NAD-dependent epimerase/dehydratase family protein [Vicinamibacteria bacterium]